MSNDVLIWPTPTRIGSGVHQIVTGAVSLARKVVHELVDGIDGDAATETLTLSYRGVDYEVHLSSRNAAALDEALAPYLESARRVTSVRTPRRTAARAGTGAPVPRDVREWARREGIEVSDRGRVRADVTRRYLEAHSA